MTNIKKTENRIYNIFCICIGLLIWSLSYFRGHVYISDNGYAVLIKELLNPIGIDNEGHAEQSILHEMIINGSHYFLTYTAGEEFVQYPAPIPEGGLRFWADGGCWNLYIDFSIAKENNEFTYRLADEMYLYESESKGWWTFLQEMAMLTDFIAAQWHNFNAFGYALMEGRHPMRMIFALALVALLRLKCLRSIQKYHGAEKQDILHRRIIYIGFAIIQFVVLAIAALQYVTFI